MSEQGKDQQPTFVLRAPVSGAGVLDPRTSILFWGTGSILLGLTITYLLIRGEFRLLVLVLLGFLALASLSVRRGVYILTVFLPFMYFLRRSILSFEEFSQRDPILVFPAAVTAAMALGVIIFHGPRILYYLKRSAALKACFALIGVFALQIFNPLQGSLLVGAAGALYFVIPTLWVLFGLMITRDDLRRLFAIVLGIGVVTAIYGIYQHYFGLSDVELYELKSKNFLKYFGSVDNVRVMSTFSGLVDFARYLTISGFLAFAYFWRRRRGVSLLLLLGLQMFAMLFTASRTSYLVTLFSIVMLVILTGSTARQVVVRGAAAVFVVALAYGFLYRSKPEQMYDQSFSSDPFVVHTLSGVTHPTRESSFKTRLASWSQIVASATLNWPLGPIGHGLGSTTAAAGKFEGGEYFEADSYFFELFYGSGLVAPILYMTVGFLILRKLARLCQAHPDEYLYRIAFGLICGFLLSSVFGVSPRDTISGPFGWLLLGWVAGETVDLKESG